MSPINYYINGSEPQSDDGYLNALSVILGGAIEQLFLSPNSPVILRFSVGVVVSGASTFAVERISLEIKYTDDNSGIQIGDSVYPLDVVVDSAITTGATLFILGLLGITTASGAVTVAIGFAVGTAVNYIYSKTAEPLVETALDYVNGTIDVDIQIKDSSGNILGGAFLIDGFSGGYTAEQAIHDMISQHSVVIDESMSIVVNPAVGASTVYQIHGGEVIERLADEFFAGSVSNLSEYVNNELYFATNAAGTVMFSNTSSSNHVVAIPVVNPSGMYGYEYFNPHNIIAVHGSAFGGSAHELFLGSSSGDTISGGAGNDNHKIGGSMYRHAA